MPPAKGRVRRARAGDLDRVAELWALIAVHHAPLDPLFRMRPGAAGELRRMLAAILRDPDAAIFVHDEAGDLPAMCIVRFDRSPPILDESERAEITDLGVREADRRRGIGRALVETALAWVAERGVERVEVRVASDNREGQAFWRALGFGDLMDVLHRRL